MFIHGYNTTFREAALQMFEFRRRSLAAENGAMRDTAFVIFSWPSRGVSMKADPNALLLILWGEYQEDRSRNKHSTRFCVAFLKQLSGVFPSKVRVKLFPYLTGAQSRRRATMALLQGHE